MNEELSKLTHDVFNELLRSDKSQRELWIESTKIALETMKLEQINQIAANLNSLDDINNQVDFIGTELEKIKHEIEFK